MTITILDTISKVSAAGKPYCQAACRGISKAGAPFLFIATIPDDLNGHCGEVIDRSVCFSKNGSAFVLPY